MVGTIRHQRRTLERVTGEGAAPCFGALRSSRHPDAIRQRGYGTPRLSSWEGPVPCREWVRLCGLEGEVLARQVATGPD